MISHTQYAKNINLRIGGISLQRDELPVGEDYFVYHQQQEGSPFVITAETKKLVTVILRPGLLWKFILAGVAILNGKTATAVLEDGHSVFMDLEKAEKTLQKVTFPW